MSFETHKLNDNGFKAVANLKKSINKLVNVLEDLPEGREKSIALTKLEECSFFATKAVASKKENHTEIITYLSK